ncbi:MAG: hypothetical protein N7Q72_07595 [Spiroplasma sp. Tabriz.8]|nr:hypothetical protein [Spiroplasma sp. Tabriz.8]
MLASYVQLNLMVENTNIIYIYIYIYIFKIITLLFMYCPLRSLLFQT